MSVVSFRPLGPVPGTALPTIPEPANNPVEDKKNSEVLASLGTWHSLVGASDAWLCTGVSFGFFSRRLRKISSFRY